MQASQSIHDESTKKSPSTLEARRSAALAIDRQHRSRARKSLGFVLMRHQNDEGSSPDMTYVGRFAPSPTGRMHLGVARTMLAAWLDARAHGGRILLRIEDIDLQRNVPGAAEQMIDDLRWLGLDF